MKKYTAVGKGQQGNTLLLTIVITGLIGFLLATYLTLVQSQNAANARSQSWNSAMPVLEAGVEEALQHLNKNGATNGSLATDGWNGSGSTYSITRPLGDAFYSVTIRDYYPGTTTNSPLIESKGYVVMPLVLASAQGALLAAAGGTPTTVNYFGRGVRARTRQDYIFTKGMVAKDNIDLNGNNIRTDSFDSTDPAYSTNGMYNPAWFKDNGDVAVNASITNSLNAGNANIYGHVSVGPDGTIAVGPQGAIGSLAWHQGGSHGVQGGWSANDMNVSFPDVDPPFTGGAFAPTGGWVTNATTTVSTSTNPSTSYAYYDYILEDGDYQVADLHGSVYVRGVATLYVTDTLDISALVIKSGSGDSLSLYCGAASASLAGNNTANSEGTATSFSFWGLPSCTELTFSGNAGFTGTIYAPNADFTLNGGGNNTIDFIGASITKTARMNGHFNFHYDEALRKIGPFRGYIVNSWNEMTPAEIPPLNLVSN